MIEVQGLSRRFGATVALADVSFRVAAGEVVGFLGPNGAGKSTTMKILTGSLAPSAGTARIGGSDIMGEPLVVRERVGFMPEHAALYEDMGVLDFLEFVAEIKGLARASRRAHLDRILEQTGLTGVRHRLVGHLSHGFRKRTCLAQALVGDPQVLILDEPTSGLDPHQIVEIRELIRSFRGRRTVLLSSHILTEVAAVCQRVLILNQGRLVGEENAEGLTSEQVEALGARSHRVILTWDGDREAVVRALAEVTGVSDLIATAEGAEVIIAGNPVEIRPKLVESVLAAGGRLQNIQDKGPTLEDLFLRLTGGDQPVDLPPGLGGEDPS